MVASQIHLVRHGEVHNPSRVLYGRIPGFGLSDRGRSMAQAAADDLARRKRPVSRVIASPLQRTQESAAPIATAFELSIENDARVIEPSNYFEGMRMSSALRNPRNWYAVRNPRKPSWGEPYADIVTRMLEAITDAWENTESGDVVLVSHQLPIWMAHSSILGIPLHHDPRKRRCSLSSITTLEHTGKRFVEVGYAEPALLLTAGAVDVGAV
ncbi:histidine phosphatase family protein [Paramicrobacterium agarici]|uniref:Broad specificity phosphatase PhoE n=1 Tax=Paramicrobacterium agarici TaxID=630514 RepID=A0A2A9DRW7_9MICO|nr:histidine phosphatase family protein [Microbacterium agarici]PFG29418.1 broad specificity phosphatase PhoE [Microbacterium agarici]